MNTITENAFHSIFEIDYLHKFNVFCGGSTLAILLAHPQNSYQTYYSLQCSTDLQDYNDARLNFADFRIEENEFCIRIEVVQ